MTFSLDSVDANRHRPDVAAKKEDAADRLKRAVDARGYVFGSRTNGYARLERAAKIGSGTVSRILNRERSSQTHETWLSLADALNVSVEWLLTGAGRDPFDPTAGKPSPEERLHRIINERAKNGFLSAFYDLKDHDPVAADLALDWCASQQYQGGVDDLEKDGARVRFTTFFNDARNGREPAPFPADDLEASKVVKKDR